jgi:probable HAF family extracellular repeat protein
MKDTKVKWTTLLATGLIIVCKVASGQSYSITNLGEFRPSGINSAGWVVGVTSSDQAVLWNGAALLDLGAPGGTQPFYSIALSINDAGKVVGGVNATGNSPTTPALWSTAGTTNLTSLGTLGGPEGLAKGINNSGMIVGTSRNINNNSYATLWNGSTIISLGTLGGSYSDAKAINSLGLVAGESYIATNTNVHATLWNGSNIMDLGTLGGANSTANAINDIGNVVGASQVSVNSKSHATLWTSTNMLDLGNLGTSSPLLYSAAWDINNAGQIVGESDFYESTYIRSHAVSWVGTSITDLNSVASAPNGWKLTQAFSINDAGLIVCSMVNSLTGQSNAVLLSPIPEPAVYALMLTGFSVILVLRRRGA